MKKLFLLLCLAGTVMLIGEDLTTKSGKVYKEYSVVGVSPQSVTVAFVEGTANIPLSDLPDDLRKKYSVEAAKRQEALRKQADAALDRRRGKNAEPVAALRKKLQEARNEERLITVRGKYGVKYKRYGIQRIGARGLTLKINGVSVYIPFLWIKNMIDGVLDVPIFAGNSLSEVEEHTKSGSPETTAVSPASAASSDPSTIYTGSRGGQFYYNRSGRKTYVRKR